MTLIACADRADMITRPPVKGSPWQIRIKQAGLTQKRLARIVGKPENTVSRQLVGEFGPDAMRYLIPVILAWEGMDPEERQDWLRRIDAER